MSRDSGDVKNSDSEVDELALEFEERLLLCQEGGYVDWEVQGWDADFEDVEGTPELDPSKLYVLSPHADGEITTRFMGRILRGTQGAVSVTVLFDTGALENFMDAALCQF